MIKVIKHPIIDIKLTKMRNIKTKHVAFKHCLSSITSLLIFEVLKNYQGNIKKVITPTNSEYKGIEFADNLIVVSILRAGLGMEKGFENIIPEIRFGHIGLYRDEKNFKIHKYFYKLPTKNQEAKVILLDPMVATGSSANMAIELLKKDGYKKIVLVSILSCPEGIKAIETKNPDVDIFVASIDEKLNEKNYIIPGLGDAGDRIFGTKEKKWK